MTHTIEFQVRSYECDSYNHVNNAVYLNYLEHARIQFMHHIGFDYKGIVTAGYYLYVTEIDIKYKASAVLDDILCIDVTPTKLKKISGEFAQKVYKKDGTVCALATVSWACVSASTGRPCKLPDEFLVEGLRAKE